jgi:hypothetical protein
MKITKTADLHIAPSILSERLTHIDGRVSRAALTVSSSSLRRMKPMLRIVDCHTALSSGTIAEAGSFPE